MYKIAISRPITTLMFVFALVFFGYTQMQKMPINYLKNVVKTTEMLFEL